MVEMQKVSGGLDLGGPMDGAPEAEPGMDGAAIRIPVGYNLKNGPTDSDLVALIRAARAGKPWPQICADEGQRIQPAALERWKSHILAEAAQGGGPTLPPNHPSLVKRAAAQSAPAAGPAPAPKASKKPAAKRARRTP